MSEPKIEWTHPAKCQWNLIVNGIITVRVYDFTDIAGFYQLEPSRRKTYTTVLRDVGFLTVQLRALELAGVK